MNKTIRISTWLSVGLFVAAVTCIVAYNAIGAEIDAQGFLRESFFLIPFFWLFLLSSLISGAVSIVARVWAKYRTATTS